MKQKAVFLDRDGTIIENRNYLGDPEQVKLLPGAAEAIRRFSQAGYLVVMASNQSGIARGRFDEEALAEVHGRVESFLQAHGATLDAVYYCPYLDGPEAEVESYRRDSDSRKPKPGMLLQAASDLGIDLCRSWMVGDSLSDVEAGQRAGCRTILIASGPTRSWTNPVAPTNVVTSLAEAADYIEHAMTTDHSPEPERRAPTHDDRVVLLLEKIHHELERSNRPDRQHDFSVLRLLATLLQMMAVLAAGFGFWELLDASPAGAAARLALAGFLQLASLSAFLMDRFR